MVGRTSEWESFLATHTHDWEFTAKAPEDDGELWAVPRRRRHGGEHARPSTHQRDTSFYASMVSAAHVEHPTSLHHCSTFRHVVCH